MDELHRSLRRQLRKCGIDPERGPDSPAQWARFLARVDATYRSSDEERYTAQRALEISSREMGELSAQIRADRERLARLIEALPQALVYTDASLLVRFANPRTAELLGDLPPGSALPSLVSLFGPGGEPVSIEVALRGDREVSAEVAGPAGRFHASWHVVPVRVGEVLDGILLVVTDLREFKAAEAALQAARMDAEVSKETEAARGRFLANVSHELRTPLNAILGYSEMLEEESEGQNTEDLNRILNAGRHLLHLINDLLDLSKIDAGKMTLVPSEFELDRVLEEIVATTEPLAQRGANRLTVHNGVRGMLRTDETRLRQCLLNLIGNAAKFTQHGHIHIEAEEQGNVIRIAVTDTGKGIPSQRLARIFDAFEQVRPGEGGTGLGLALTRAFVQLMGGEISATSEVGEGSTFRIEVPRICA